MEKMIQKIKNYIACNHLFGENERVVVGVSGGADSVLLLHVLVALKNDYGLELYAVHVNHGIRKEAQEDANFVGALCKQLEVPLFVFREDIKALAKQCKKSEEEAGRDYRYQCFDEVAKTVDATKIAVAHHENDQSETVLYHLIRGADLNGVSGMQPIFARKDKIEIVRPLLGVEKNEIVSCLEKEGISWVVDATNQDNIYARNRLRNAVIPQLEEVNAQSVHHIARFAKKAFLYDEFVKKLAISYIDENVEYEYEDGDMRNVLTCRFHRDQFMELDYLVASQVLYEVLGTIGGSKKDLNEEHIDRLYAFLQLQSGKQIDLPYGISGVLMYEMVVLRKCLHNKDHKEDISLHVYGQPFSWEDGYEQEVTVKGIGKVKICCYTMDTLLGQANLSFEDSGDIDFDSFFENNIHKNNYTKYFDCDKMRDKFCVRNARPKDYLNINENGDCKKLSKYFKDCKIPLELRERILVLAYGQEILCVFGYRRCERYKITKDTKHILAISYEGE